MVPPDSDETNREKRGMSVFGQTSPQKKDDNVQGLACLKMTMSVERERERERESRNHAKSSNTEKF
ncbi:MAG: hypothetical protein LBK40_03655 [Spirochaetaceae bacterium]|jgi:hypothetical protein|nr:hypothetical protein [Spirochaetaceae bacterium]